MLKNLIEIGNSFSDKFTDEYGYGSEMGINNANKGEYFKWLSKVGVYVERNFKAQLPDMTKQIIKYVSEKSLYHTDYSIIMGYLESAEEIDSNQKTAYVN